MPTRFYDRAEAGRLLARELAGYANQDDVIVLALPRGGVPVGLEAAEALDVALDVLLVRKLGVPGQEELPLGAIAAGGVRVLNEEIVRWLRIPDEVIKGVVAKQEQERRRHERLYRRHRAVPEVRGKTVILIDDGVATGSTMRAAVAALKKQHPSRIIIAVPTAAPYFYEELSKEVDEMIALMTPDNFFGIGQWYVNFSRLSDAEVIDLLERAGQRLEPSWETRRDATSQSEFFVSQTRPEFQPPAPDDLVPLPAY